MTLDLLDRSLLRFLQIGNGKGTPEDTLLARFYTAWAKSGLSITDAQCNGNNA